jgi:hypothetical protein
MCILCIAVPATWSTSNDMSCVSSLARTGSRLLGVLIARVEARTRGGAAGSGIG